jgi:hypothetical protein
LCQNGLPTGDLYEFAALQILKFEKRWRQKQRKQQIKARVGGEEEGKKSITEPSEATPARTTGKGKPEPVHEEAKRAHGEDKKRPKEEAKKAANEPVLSKKPTAEALPKKPAEPPKKQDAKKVQDQPARAEESPKRRPEEAKGKKK